MLVVGLWAVLIALVIVWLVLFVKFRTDHGIWKTKKDFSFDDLDKLLETQDYKYEVSKYLHKYKSDRRAYEDRIAKIIGVLIVLAVLILADVAFLAWKTAF